MKLIISTLVFILWACSSTKEMPSTTEQVPVILESNNVPYNTVITIHHYKPYCGGAYPTQDILDRQNSAKSNTDFLLINLKDDSRSTVTTNAEGIIYLNLQKGNYSIREMYKDCSFEEFLINNTPPNSDNYQPSTDSDCYENWWKANLGEIEIVDTDSAYSYNWVSREACFTGNNPCISYTGPWPP